VDYYVACSCFDKDIRCGCGSFKKLITPLIRTSNRNSHTFAQCSFKHAGNMKCCKLSVHVSSTGTDCTVS
jgi:hypothetical protein